MKTRRGVGFFSHLSCQNGEDEMSERVSAVFFVWQKSW